MYTVVFSLKGKEAMILLMQDDVCIAKNDWVEKNDVLEQFFDRLDGLLVAQNLSIEDIADFSFEMGRPMGYTTARIAQTIIKTLNFAHKMR